ncbi:MAG: DNA polymerase III subunit beta [Bacilli bacterium]|nr:DNA polymerase III subunit beta [Bacilli bacterium]MDD4053321.1 DNA polymerase III subunit beta [Bacilli bacterium]MDD4411338.1 DNA polymerase III subunit beta [Bacilli bacterium]
MNLKIKRDILLSNLNYVSKAVSSKNVIPVLAGIKWVLNEKGLSLEASDESIIINCFIDKEKIEEIKEYGSVVIPGRYILDIIRKMPNELINIETDGLKILITTPSSEYTLNGIDSQEFPDYPLELNKKPIIMNQKVLINIINQTSFAASTQESRPILTGINIKIKEKSLEAVATDSYRLSKKVIDINEGNDDPVDIVIPKVSLIELLKILNEEEIIELHIFNNKIVFKFENILFQSRLLNGTFPNISTLIPTDYTLEVTSKLNDLYNVIDRTSLLSDSDKNIIQMEIKNNELITTCDTLQVGKVEERIIIEKNNPVDIKISFNAKFMMDALKSFNGDNVVLLLTNETKQFVIKDKTDESLIQLIVPVRTY